MKSKLAYLLFGAGIGGGSHYLYRYYNPERTISISSQELIDSYTNSHNLDSNFLIQVLKSISLMLKGFYHYSLDTKLEGFNYNSIYLKRDQVKDQEQQISEIFCIFNPTDYICGHPEIQHGGATATIIDQNMGYLAILNSRSSVATAELNIKYKRPVKKGQYYVFEGKVDKRQGRKIYLTGKVKDMETGEVKVESNALFMTVNWDNSLTRILTKFFTYLDGQELHNNPPKQTTSIEQKSKSQIIS